MRKFSRYCTIFYRLGCNRFLAGKRELKKGLWCGRCDGVVGYITHQGLASGYPGVTIEPGETGVAGNNFWMGGCRHVVRGPGMHRYGPGVSDALIRGGAERWGMCRAALLPITSIRSLRPGIFKTNDRKPVKIILIRIVLKKGNGYTYK